jgi:hypothetical protein
MKLLIDAQGREDPGCNRARSNDRHMGEVTIAYGMTEISPVSFHSSTADPVEKWVSTVGGPAAYRGQDQIARSRIMASGTLSAASSARTMNSSPRLRSSSLESRLVSAWRSCWHVAEI